MKIYHPQMICNISFFSLFLSRWRRHCKDLPSRFVIYYFLVFCWGENLWSYNFLNNFFAGGLNTKRLDVIWNWLLNIKIMHNMTLSWNYCISLFHEPWVIAYFTFTLKPYVHINFWLLQLYWVCRISNMYQWILKPHWTICQITKSYFCATVHANK